MSIFDRRVLVNYDNIDNLYVQKICQPYTDTQWEIRMYAEGITLARFYDEKECVEVFNEVINKVYDQNKNIIFITPHKKYTFKR